MEALKNLELTEKDFQMLVDGLEQLPNKGEIGSLMADLLIGSLIKEDGPEKEKFKRDRDIERRKKEAEKESLIEDVRILQGKLLAMKRYMAQENLLKQAKDILGS